MQRNEQTNKAFTLIELSIVVVIIGLIVAGVLAGQSLVKQTKLRKVISDYEGYQLAINSFKLQYSGLPGDLSNAHSYWGSNCDASAANCNGNNDKNILGVQETRRFWQHLRLAGLINGNYTGVAGAQPYVPGENYPRYTGGTSRDGYLAMHHSNNFSTTGNTITLAEVDISSNTPWNESVFSVPEAKNIDQKMDDGIANKGRLYGINGVEIPTTGCSNVWSNPGADYNLSSTASPACRLYFWLD